MKKKLFLGFTFFYSFSSALSANPAGEHLYIKKCSHCHGLKGEQSVFETSAVIQGWQTSKTIEALHGYKDNSYGSTKKGVMKVVVARLDEASMKDVATYIETLK
ncbi:MAG: cytochrome c [Arcobacteraceae bacterium]